MTLCSRFATPLVPIFLAAALLLAAPSSAQFGQNKVRHRQLDFIVLETPHFDIYYYASETEAARQAAVLAERWYERISKALGHDLSRRQPLVLYDSPADFRQTNVVRGILDEATGGVTEGMRNRMVLPLGPTLADTNHVIGHELVHAFQYDIARHGHGSLLMMPLWVIEGMAEYFSVAPAECQTAIWMRDALGQPRLPTVKELASPRYFPYRYGHALWTYLASRFGEPVVATFLRAKPAKLDQKILAATGLTMEQLTTDWHAWLRASYGGSRESSAAAESRVLLDRKSGGRLNVAPALSPRGDRLAFMSEKDDFAVELFLFDVGSGRTIRKLVSRSDRARYDSLEFIESSAAWSPGGTRLAMTALRGGTPVLVILDGATGETVREYRFPALRQLRHPSWSPDGTRIAFSGVQGGWSDLYAVSLDSGELTRWTADAYAELQPAWSPDGRSVAFATDRFTTSLTTLTPGSFRLARLDVAASTIEELPGTAGGRNITPQWLTGGQALLFLSDHDGTPDVYRLDLERRLVSRVTQVQTGVSGITALSPAFSLATREPLVAYTVYRNGGYQIHTVPVGTGQALVPGLPVAEAAGPSGDTALSTSREGTTDRFRDRPYRRRLALSGIAEPYFAAGGGPLGSYFRVGLGLSFADMLGDREVGMALQGGRTREDFAARLGYVNRARRVNWGVSFQYLPALFARAESQATVDSLTIERTTELERQRHAGAYGVLMYPLDRARRVELSAGFRHVAFGRELRHAVVALPTNKTLEEHRRPLTAPSAIRLVESNLAYVHDSTIFGATGPVLGRRYRFEIGPSFGSVPHVTVLADVRRYLMPVRPVTVALRARYTRRWGAGADDPRLLPLVLTLRDQVRGYDLRRMAFDACGGPSGLDCSVIEMLTGSSLLAANLEVRAPLFGFRAGEFDYGPLPTELFLFADAAALRARRISDDGQWGGGLLRSVGGGLRVNAAGMILEAAIAHPFDRRGRGWTFAFNLGPGF